jgi:hypothetical protein
MGRVCSYVNERASTRVYRSLAMTQDSIDRDHGDQIAWDSHKLRYNHFFKCGCKLITRYTISIDSGAVYCTLLWEMS